MDIIVVALGSFCRWCDEMDMDEKAFSAALMTRGMTLLHFLLRRMACLSCAQLPI